MGAMWAESGILDECRNLLLQAEEALCDAEAVLGNDKNSTKQHSQKDLLAAQDPQSLALHILAFERRILVEWLHYEFLQHRMEWRRGLLYARSFKDLRSLILQLRAGLQTPPTQQRLASCVSKALGRSDISELVVDYVVGHRELRALMQAALFCCKSARK